MPAIASLEDLRAAQKDLLEAKDVNELKTVFKNGVKLVGRTSVEPLWERLGPFKGWVGATSRPQANGLLCRGKLWLEEQTPEQLKGEGGQ